MSRLANADNMTIKDLAKKLNIPEDVAKSYIVEKYQISPNLFITDAPEGQKFDRELGRFVGVDRPEGFFKPGAQFVDFITGGLTDLDQSGGGIFGRNVENTRSGFGAKPSAEDIQLPTNIVKQVEEEFKPQTTILEQEKERIAATKEVLPDILEMQRKINRDAAIQNQLQYITTEPVRQAFANRAAEAAAQRGLRIRAAKEAMPSNIQNIMLSKQAQQATASSAEAERARAAADQQDAASRFAALGTARRFG